MKLFTEIYAGSTARQQQTSAAPFRPSLLKSIIIQFSWKIEKSLMSSGPAGGVAKVTVTRTGEDFVEKITGIKRIIKADFKI